MKGIGQKTFQTDGSLAINLLFRRPHERATDKYVCSREFCTVICEFLSTCWAAKKSKEPQPPRGCFRQRCRHSHIIIPDQRMLSNVAERQAWFNSRALERENHDEAYFVLGIPNAEPSTHPWHVYQLSSQALATGGDLCTRFLQAYHARSGFLLAETVGVGKL